jgi:hypothetical protein
MDRSVAVLRVDERQQVTQKLSRGFDVARRALLEQPVLQWDRRRRCPALHADHRDDDDDGQRHPAHPSPHETQRPAWRAIRLRQAVVDRVDILLDRLSQHPRFDTLG